MLPQTHSRLSNARCRSTGRAVRPGFHALRTSRVGAALLAAALAALTGCASTGPPAGEEPAVVTPPPPPEPLLRTSGDAHLTVFGEMPGRERIAYKAVAASPMTQHSFSTEGADADVDVSPDGRWLVYCSTQHSAQPDLYLKSIDGRAVTQLTSDPAADVQPCFSPDGRQVAFASCRSGNWDIWITGLEGGQAVQITNSPLHEVHPSFSPEGRRLVFCLFNDKAGQWELWTLNLDQPAARRMIGTGLFPEWSPRGESIVYQKARQRGGRFFSIWRVDLRNGEPMFPVELAASSEMAFIQPSWAPGGDWITYGSAVVAPGAETTEDAVATQRGDIWIMQADGSSVLRLTDGAGTHFGPVWSPDGRVFFSSLQNGSENIWSARPLFDGGGSGSEAAASAGSQPAGPGDGPVARKEP